MEAGALAARCDVSQRHIWVPDWLVLYAFLGLGDLAFTLAAFEYGATEANPLLRGLQTTGLFEFTKLSLTLLVVCIGYRFRTNHTVQVSVSMANVMMIALNVYHVSLLSLYT